MSALGEEYCPAALATNSVPLSLPNSTQLSFSRQLIPITSIARKPIITRCHVLISSFWANRRNDVKSIIRDIQVPPQPLSYQALCSGLMTMFLGLLNAQRETGGKNAMVSEMLTAEMLCHFMNTVQQSKIEVRGGAALGQRVREREGETH